MKKLLALLLALLVPLVTLVACRGRTEPDEPDPDEGKTPGDDPNAPVDPSKPSDMQTGLYTPTAQKQRDTYRAVTAQGMQDGPYLIETVYATEQTVVAEIIVTPEQYDVDPTGVKDSTAGIQKALDDCAAMGGGTVFLPVGRYILTDTVSIPFGVVLHGDWQDPELTEAPEYGTVILAKVEPLSDAEIYDPAARPLFLLLTDGDANNGLIGLTVYYPEQDVTSVKPYGYTVYGECPRMAMLRDLTFINSYNGIGANLTSQGRHELLQIERVRMTVLSTGYRVMRSSEIGYTVDLRISPKYWRDAAAEFACPDADALRTWCRANTLGMEFDTLDLNQYTDLYLDGCHTALLLGSSFWSVFYNVQITDAVYGIVARDLSGSCGVAFSRVDIEADRYAVANYAVGRGAIKFADIELHGKGGIHTADGAKTVIDNDDDLSSYAPERISYVKPASVLYVADVTALDGVKQDAALAIQQALDKASETGGVVYIPHGIYSLYTPLSVPAGVELRGAASMAARDRDRQSGPISGTVLLSYVGEGDLITLAERSGVSGLRIFYPIYDAVTALGLLEQNADVTNTSVAIRGQGAYVYVLNSVISGAMVGVDFTDCNGHVVKQTFGCAFRHFVRAGGEGGTLMSVLCNLTYTTRQPFYTRGYYDAERVNAGNWSFLSETNAKGFSTLRDKVLRQYCETVYLKDAADETLSNVFMYGGHTVLTTDHSSAKAYNVTTDWQGICPMMVIKNGSDVISFNAYRTSGSSHECDESSSLVMYNRLINGLYLEPTYRSDFPLNDNMGGEVLDYVTLLDCETLGKAQGVVLNTDPAYVKEGKASFKVSGDDPKLWLGTTLDAVSTEGMDRSNLYLHLWLYIDDPYNVAWSGNCISLTTANGEHYDWYTTTPIKQAGWNEIVLPLADGFRATGEMVADGFDSISIRVIYNDLGVYPTVYIDDITICELMPYTDYRYETTETLEPYESVPSLSTELRPRRIMLLNCDTTDGVSDYARNFTTLNTDPAYVKEGSGSLKMHPTGMVCFEATFPASDATAFKGQGYLHLWVYVSRAAAFAGDGQIELTSSGTYDKNELNWNVSEYIKNDGWNELWLPIHDKLDKSGLDIGKINYLRIYATGATTADTVFVDDVYLCNVVGATYNDGNTEPAGSAQPAYEALPVLHRCDSARGLKGVTLCNDPTYVKEGTGSLCSAAGAVERLTLHFDARDVTAYMDGYLHMWVYIENPEDLRGGQIELTSGGTCDVQELYWDVSVYLTESGWNELLLPLYDKYTRCPAFDPTHCNYLRIYTQWKTGTTDHNMYFDDIRFVEGDGSRPIPPPTEQPEKPDEPSTPSADDQMLLSCDALPERLGVQATVNTDGTYVKQGSGSLHTSASLVRLELRFDALDVRSYKGGYLHLWIYVADINAISGGQFELTSGNTCDKEELFWSVNEHVKQNGWNEVYLPLSAPAGKVGEIDLSRVNYLRMHTGIKQADAVTDLYFDDIRFTNER